MDREIERQLVHAFSGSILILVLVICGRIALLAFACIACAFVLIASLAVKNNINLPFVTALVKWVGRKKERTLPGSGAIFFFLGLILLLLLFDNSMVIMGAMIVAVYGDAASTLVGKTIGRIRLVPPYTLEGSFAGFLLSFLLLRIIFPIFPAFIAAFAGMLVEMLPIDDNLTIPLACALVLTLLA